MTEKDWDGVVEKIKYQILSWYEDEGEYQPTEEQADEEIKKILSTLLKQAVEEGKDCCVSELGCLCKPDSMSCDMETCLCPSHYGKHKEWLKSLISKASRKSKFIGEDGSEYQFYNEERCRIQENGADLTKEDFIMYDEADNFKKWCNRNITSGTHDMKYSEILSDDDICRITSYFGLVKEKFTYEATRQRIGEIIGEASICWSEIPKGIFNSEKASELVDEIMAHIEHPLEHQDDKKSL